MDLTFVAHDLQMSKLAVEIIKCTTFCMKIKTVLKKQSMLVFAILVLWDVYPNI